MNPGNHIAQYLSQLRSGLAGMTLAEREDIVEEIRAHIRERTAESGASAEETLERLGPASELAREYSSGALVRRATTSFSPWLMLRATFRWSMTGLHGFALFMVALSGYGIGLGFILCALLKPLFPDETGMWIGPGVFNFGFRPTSVPEGREVLGEWFTQVSLVAGGLFFVATTLLVRSWIPRVKRWRDRARNHEETAHAAS